MPLPAAVPFTIADLPAAGRVAGLVWPEYTEIFRKEIDAYYRLPDVFWPDAFIVRRGDELIGFAQLITSSLSHQACELCWVMVDPACRNQGIGEALVRAAIAKAGERDQTLFFSTFSPALYQRIGLQPVGEWREGRHYFIVPPGTINEP